VNYGAALNLPVGVGRSRSASSARARSGPGLYEEIKANASTDVDEDKGGKNHVARDVEHEGR